MRRKSGARKERISNKNEKTLTILKFYKHFFKYFPLIFFIEFQIQNNNILTLIYFLFYFIIISYVTEKFSKKNLNSKNLIFISKHIKSHRSNKIYLVFYN